MAIINQLDKPVSSRPQAPQQTLPPENQEMVIRPAKKENKILTRRNIVGSLAVIFIMMFGIAGGLFLVQREAIFQSKANSGWEVDETNFEFCNINECILPSNLTYCPGVSGFELTTGSCIGQGAIDINCSVGMSGYAYHCPEQKEGNCYQNKKFIGTYKTGQTIDAVALVSQFDCGTAQLEFDSNSESSILGGCGAIVLRDSRCSAK